jgi:hypothetical protein
VNPVVLEKGRYLAPLEPGFSAEMRPQTLQNYVFPEGPAWATHAALAPAMSADPRPRRSYWQPVEE